MTVNFPTAYPAALTNAAWQKKKSFKDKLKSKTKTGLGAALVLAEKEWKKIAFNKLDASKQTGAERGARPLPMLRANRAAAQVLLDGQVNTTVEALMAASSKAAETGKNTSLSATAQKAATAVSLAAMKQAALLKGLTLADFDQEISEAEEEFEQGKDEYESRVKRIRSAVESLRRTPTATNWKNSGETLEKEVFLGYHFVITAVDTLKLQEYNPARPLWAKVDEQLGRAKPLVGAAMKKKPNDEAVREAVLNFTRSVYTELAKIDK
jgi:hypothetical protein